MKKIYLSLAMLLYALVAFSQNSVDVLRFSRNFNGGTARYMAMGGAFGALGADFSTLSVNPAGIGIYKKSVFVGSPSVFLSNTKTTMDNSTDFDSKNNFNMNNYGFVFVNRMNHDKKGWKAVQFGIGVNRLNNFNRSFNMTNHNTESSLITDYQDQAYGKYPDQLDAFSTDLAWKTYLFQDTTRVNGGILAYTSALNKGGAEQRESVKEWGSVNELTFAFGGSYNDIFYIGGAVGFPFARFYQQVHHFETDDADTIADFKSFSMNRYLETHGNGVNFRLGVIVRPASILRLGFSFESPTWYSMNDYYYNDMEQLFENGTKLDAKSPDGHFDYRITTPMKLNGSAAFILGRFLIVSAEAEYLDYSSGFLSSRTYTFSSENNDVKNKYGASLNGKAGVEFHMRPMSFRVGAAVFGNPYKEGINESVRYQLSAGLGYRDRDFFFDIAYVYSQETTDYYMYDPVFVGPASVKENIHQIVMTVGIKFD